LLTQQCFAVAIYGEGDIQTHPPQYSLSGGKYHKDTVVNRVYDCIYWQTPIADGQNACPIPDSRQRSGTRSKV